ncbi:MAG: YcaQ family DNA glycosylase [Chloroflexi bacterium]|nr:YcaQ family DNA glycosylase [Chloroflexota bacterium]
MSPLTLSPQTVRRAAVAAQHLAGPFPTPTREAMLAVLHQIRCLQLDPIRAVERTQYLVLWSRLGTYDRALLHQLIYQERLLFEYWAHAASIVLTEDYHLHDYMMRRYDEGRTSAWGSRIMQWVEENEAFKQSLLDQIAERGPQLPSDFEDKARVPWDSSGWTNGRSVAYMLDHLWTRGQIMVSQRDGLKRWWDLAERVLPPDLPTGWTAAQVTRDAAQKSLRALGVATEREISKHFTEGRYPELGRVLAELVAEGQVIPVQVAGWENLPHYAHVESLPLLEQLQAGAWEPRTTLLSPFDNLIRDRERTERLWDFYYRIEIYVPAAKRQYGYYVLPILHGETLIGRVSPRMDWKKKVLHIEAVYAEPNAPQGEQTGTAVAGAIHHLADFLGAKTITYDSKVPPEWAAALLG